MATAIAPRPASAKNDERPDPDLPARQAGNAFGVDEDLAHLQARDERRRHPVTVSLEELDQVEVRPHGDDQLGPFLVG